MKGVVLAGGKGTRLGELTRVTNKHLLPVGNMPMIYYPIKKLIGAGIEEIMIITGTEHVGDYVELLGSGNRLGCELTYRVQEEAGGIAQALGLAERFVGNNYVVVILGDNIFKDKLSIAGFNGMAKVWLKQVPDPRRFGIPVMRDGKIIAVKEKPKDPMCDLAVTGIYAYDPYVFERIKLLRRSARGEYEISDVNSWYAGFDQSRLTYDILEGYWTDAGTPESLALANRLVNEDPPNF